MLEFEAGLRVRVTTPQKKNARVGIPFWLLWFVIYTLEIQPQQHKFIRSKRPVVSLVWYERDTFLKKLWYCVSRGVQQDNLILSTELII